MTKTKIYQVDAFANALFKGNPAAICPLDSWLDDATMQYIAAENNLAETAFVVREGESFRIRWFTPLTEVELCGHATLASAHVLLNHEGIEDAEITFASRSGDLRVTKGENGLITLDFPTTDMHETSVSEKMIAGLRTTPAELYLGKHYYMAVFENENQVADLYPDFRTLSLLDYPIIATAPSTGRDFVSRFFAPSLGIDEDPVTGSAHCMLTPYWSKRLGKKSLHAIQISQREGELFCEDKGDRTLISGRAITYLEGEISF